MISQPALSILLQMKIYKTVIVFMNNQPAKLFAICAKMGTRYQNPTTVLNNVQLSKIIQIRYANLAIPMMKVVTNSAISVLLEVSLP